MKRNNALSGNFEIANLEEYSSKHQELQILECDQEQKFLTLGKMNKSSTDKMKGIKILLASMFLLLVLLMIVPGASAANSTVCCEKTKATGAKGSLYCQNVPANECEAGAQQVPTSCESTSYCRVGTCYNSLEGTCLDNTPQQVCTANGGTWSLEAPAQCSLGCCVLGDQAAFVSLVRCKRLSSFLGLATNYKINIKDEVQCVLEVQNQEQGACVFEHEFEKTCRYTTRSACMTGVNGTKTKGEFFGGKLCTAEEIGAPCAPTRQTTCVPGKDEVYFVDSCGNAANIYDASKVNDANYWKNVVDKTAACSPLNGNIDSKACGNCNYLQGSYCRPAAKSNTPTYGGNICANLNCQTTSVGPKKHGESWCVYADSGKQKEGNNAVGSRFYKHICINGQETLEQCADFRQEECIQDVIKTSAGDFSQAACRVNRWQDCTTQQDKQDCENSDRRDCSWKSGATFGNATGGACIPLVSPGLQFWKSDETKSICAQASASCVVMFEKGLLGSEKCIKNCECLTDDWKKQRSDLCVSLGDCGPKVNWVGSQGYKEGFTITKGKVK